MDHITTKIFPASISRRFWAAVLDIILLTVTYAIVGISLQELLLDAPDWLQLTTIFMVFFLFTFYKPLAESLFNGYTMGKKIVGIRVVSANGHPASPLQCFQRYLAMIIEGVGLFIPALVTMTITAKRQRLGDLLADTIVVRDNAQLDLMDEYSGVDARTQSDYTREVMKKIRPGKIINTKASPLDVADLYHETESDIARLRTEKAHPAVIGYLERLLASLRSAMFRRQVYTRKEAALYFLRSIPRAVYECRRSIFIAFGLAVLAIIIGAWQQVADNNFFREFLGESYYEETVENIMSGNPTSVYGRDSEVFMFWHIFTNNFLVTLNAYAFGLIIFIGPLYFLMQNFIMLGTFFTFFAQNGVLSDALIAVNEHGTLELTSIIIASGAGIELGTGWLFPGKMSRYKAWMRSARRSVMVMVSVLPMILVAAFIESFITRHVEWPIGVRLGIIILSFLFILAYYVVLPIKAKRN